MLIWDLGRKKACWVASLRRTPLLNEHPDLVSDITYIGHFQYSNETFRQTPSNLTMEAMKHTMLNVKNWTHLYSDSSELFYLICRVTF